MKRKRNENPRNRNSAPRKCRLSLQQETVRVMSSPQLNQVIGGDSLAGWDSRK